jgi:predicted  nucleic acid-binding Zn-ribbon protein
MAFSKEAHEKRRDEVEKKIDAIRSKSGPLREKRDAHVQKARAREDEMNAEIAKAEKGLADLEQERAFLNRALGARTLG